MPKLTITAPPNLAHAFGTNGTVDDATLEQLTTLALEHWTAALTGPVRFRSMTELYLAWLRDVFDKFWPDEEPTERLLYARLGIPYSQAVYLARVLRENKSAALRKQSLRKLRDELDKKLVSIKQSQKKGSFNPEADYELIITKGARRELDLLYEEQITAGNAVRPYRPSGVVANLCGVVIKAADIETLRTAADTLIAQL